jgi:hypothetical protein
MFTVPPTLLIGDPIGETRGAFVGTVASIQTRSSVESIVFIWQLAICGTSSKPTRFISSGALEITVSRRALFELFAFSLFDKVLKKCIKNIFNNLFI